MRTAIALPLLVLLLAGCKSAVQSGVNTALDGVDLQAVTDRMAASIAGSPQVQAEIAREGALRVVVQPVVNEMRAEVLPRGPADAFTARVRTLLSKHAHDQFIWVMNRDAYDRLRNSELELGPAPESVQPRYALTAYFQSLTSEDSRRRSIFYQCVYELTDLERRNVLWTDKYEIKKTAVKGFLD